jgi:hypothetical protein
VTAAAEPQALERLRFLAETVALEAAHLAAALQAGHAFVPLLLDAATALGREVRQRFEMV